MATTAYGNRPIVVMPSAPVAADIAVQYRRSESLTASPFTGKQTCQVWSPGYLELDLTYPALTDDDAAAIQQWIVDARGVFSVFPAPSWLTSLGFASRDASGLWCFTNMEQAISVTPGDVYGFHTVIREVL